MQNVKLLIITLFISLFIGCIVTNTPSYTERHKSILLEPDGKILENLKIPFNNFSGVVLLYKTLENNTNINIKILRVRDKTIELKKIFSLNTIERKYRTLKFLFPYPLKNSKDKDYILEITADKNIKIFGGEDRIYHKAIYKIKLKNVIKEFLRKFYADKPFFYFYIALIIFLIVLIFLTKTKKEKQNSE